MLGRFLPQHDRDSFVIATKVGRYSTDPKKMFDFSREMTLKSGFPFSTAACLLTFLFSWRIVEKTQLGLCRHHSSSRCRICAQFGHYPEWNAARISRSRQGGQGAHDRRHGISDWATRWVDPSLHRSHWHGAMLYTRVNGRSKIATICAWVAREGHFYRQCVATSNGPVSTGRTTTMAPGKWWSEGGDQGTNIKLSLILHH